jgi:hypothetical protein
MNDWPEIVTVNWSIRPMQGGAACAGAESSRRKYPAPARLQISWLPRTAIHGATRSAGAAGAKKSACHVGQSSPCGLPWQPLSRGGQTLSR